MHVCAIACLSVRSLLCVYVRVCACVLSKGVYVELCGKDKDGKEVWGARTALDNSKNNFERGEVIRYLNACSCMCTHSLSACLYATCESTRSPFENMDSCSAFPPVRSTQLNIRTPGR